MSLLSDRDREAVRGMLAAVKSPVTLLFFTQAIGCEGCDAARQILDEVAALSDRVTVEEVNFVLDKEKVAAYGIDRVPAIAVVTDHDTRIRFYGAPSGYEFMSLLDAVILASDGHSHLSESSLAIAHGISSPTSIQVFVTPT